MSAYIDPDLLSAPLNGLTSATEIMNEQYNILTDSKQPISSSELDIDAFRAVPAEITSGDKPLYTLSETLTNPMTDGTTIPTLSPSSLVLNPSPSATDLIETTTAAPTTAPATREPQYFNGPKRTGKTIGSVAENYGLPTSIQQTIDDAQDAVLGITGDLVRARENKTSVYEIITKDNRLRGIGSLLILVAIVGFLVKILAGT